MPLASAVRNLAACCALCGVVAMADLAQAGGADVEAAAWSGSGPAVAIAADAKSEANRTRLVFTLSKAVTPHAFVMERPDRVIVDLPEVNFQLPADAGRRREGMVASYRYGLFAPGRSRIVIDLAQTALVSSVALSTRASDGAVLMTIELTRADREAFRKAVAAGDPDVRLRASAAPPDSSDDRRPVIVIDAGHGGIDPGAISAGVVEKDIVFAFAQTLRRKLEAAQRYRVVMTRDHDIFVSLDDRVRRARAAKADLFISIHADTIARGQVRGATVYTVADRASDAESAKLADRENSADAAAGIAQGDQPEEVADILQDLTQRETRGFSHRFAGQLIHELNPVTRFNSHPHRQGGFKVLRAPDVPSVLVELGYLSSSKDIELLQSEDWRERSTGAMSVAIDRFFGTRLAKGSTAPVSP